MYLFFMGQMCINPTNVSKEKYAKKLKRKLFAKIFLSFTFDQIIE